MLFTGFPWNLLGTVWAFDALPLQAASVIGVHGLSLLTLLLAGLPLLASGTAAWRVWTGAAWPWPPSPASAPGAWPPRHLPARRYNWCWCRATSRRR